MDHLLQVNEIYQFEGEPKLSANTSAQCHSLPPSPPHARVAQSAVEERYLISEEISKDPNSKHLRMIRWIPDSEEIIPSHPHNKMNPAMLLPPSSPPSLTSSQTYLVSDATIPSSTPPPSSPCIPSSSPVHMGQLALGYTRMHYDPSEGLHIEHEAHSNDPFHDAKQEKACTKSPQAPTSVQMVYCQSSPNSTYAPTPRSPLNVVEPTSELDESDSPACLKPGVQGDYSDTLPGIHIDLSTNENVNKPEESQHNDIQIDETHVNSEAPKNDNPPSSLGIKRPASPSTLVKPPAPKRLTLTSQKQQYRKLLVPFRSPLTARAVTPENNLLNSDDTTSPLKAPPSTANHKLVQTPVSYGPSTRDQNTPPSSKRRGRERFSVKAAAPFKSPLASKSSVLSNSARPLLSPNIQALERRLQTLKQAVKIKQADDDAKLEGLVKQWRTAGREAAWDLWHRVKDDFASNGTDLSSSNNRWSMNAPSASSSWGWDKPEPDAKDESQEDMSSFTPPPGDKLEQELYRSLNEKITVPRSSMLPPTPRGSYFTQAIRYQCDESQEEIDSNPKKSETTEEVSHSLGTLLTRLGIAHETFGWIEFEGDFVDPD